MNCHDQSQLIVYDEMVQDSVLEQRLFLLADKDKAVSKIKSVVGNQYTVNAHEKYIMVTPAYLEINTAEVNEVINRLERATRFFSTYYHLRAPDKFITVYLAPDNGALQTLGKKIHNLQIPRTLYGYSVLNDLSLLGIANTQQIGTLIHELFHLMVRTDAGDLPAWLDEGMASLYSTCYWQGDILKGGKTWRRAQLYPEYRRLTRTQILPLKELVSLNWEQFNGGEGVNLCQAAVNYSVANHFLLFLQEKSILQELVSKYRNRPDPGGPNSPPAPDNIMLLEDVMQKPIDQIQHEFSGWLEHQMNSTSSDNTPEIETINRPREMSFNEILMEANGFLRIVKQSSKEKDVVVYKKYSKEIPAIEKEYHIWEKKYDDAMNQKSSDTPSVKGEQMQVQQTISNPYSEKLNNALLKMDEQKEKLKQAHAELKRATDKPIYKK